MGGRNRTAGLLIPNQEIYQLIYTHIKKNVLSRIDQFLQAINPQYFITPCRKLHPQPIVVVIIPIYCQN